MAVLDVIDDPGIMAGIHALVICSFNRVRDGVHIGDGVVMQEYMMTLIGIALVAVVVIIWA